MSNNQQSTTNDQPLSTKKLSVWKGTWALIRYRPGYFTLSVSMALYVFTTRGLVGWLQKLFFDGLSGGAQVGRNLWTLLALIVAVELSRMVLDTVGDWSAAKVRLAGQSLLRKNALQNILRKPGAEPLPFSSGDVVSRFDNELGDYGDFPTWIPMVVGHFSFALFALIVMFGIAPRITAVSIIPLIGVFFLTQFAWEKFLHYNRESRESDSVITGFLGEIFGSIQALKVADAEAATMHYFEQISQHRRKMNVRNGVFWTIFRSAADNIGDIAVALMIVMAGVAMSNGEFSVGDFALFSSYLFFVARFPAELGSYVSEIAQQRVVLDRMQALQPDVNQNSLVSHGPIEASGELASLQVKTPADQLQMLEVKGLSYQFLVESDEWRVVSEDQLTTNHSPLSTGIFDINLTIPRGSFTVITGRIGSGKTTLLRVLLGLLPAQSGEMYWNGMRVDAPDSFFVPPRSAYTPQVPHLFSQTLRDNILFGLSESEVDLMGGVETAVLSPDIATLEKGLDTIVGPRGVRLSGGQIQRAAAARMLVRDADLLVFDDLSSALDVETEKQLWEGLIGSRQLPTIHYPLSTFLVVSHRRTVLKMADNVVVMGNGRIVAQGTLDELLESSEDMRAIWHGRIDGQGGFDV